MTKKFAPKFIGPFPVAAVISPANMVYKLQLPPDMMRIHPVFHVSLLQPWQPDRASQHPDTQTEPGPINGDEDPTQFLVDRLLDKRIRRLRGGHTATQYLVRWQGYGPERDSWVHENIISKDLIAEYARTHHA